MGFKLKRRSLRLLCIFVIFLGGVVISVAYLVSNNLKTEADQLVKEGQVGEAITLYDKAHSIFPLRQDIVSDLRGAKLIMQSDLDYGRISDIDYAEVQAVPPLTALPSLLPNEIFVPILMYHHIEVNPRPKDPIWASLFVTPEQLDSQLKYFSTNGYNIISLDELHQALVDNKSLPEKSIVLTFDDGYKSFYTNAFPLLKKYNLKATEFVITQVETAPAYFSWDEISQMDKSGLIQFGAHTRHHPNLPGLSQSAIVNEIMGSKNDLEQHLKKPITWFAYPYGSYNNFIVQTVRNSGFVGAVSTVYGAGQSRDKLFLEPRIMVDGRYTLFELIDRIKK